MAKMAMEKIARRLYKGIVALNKRVETHAAETETLSADRLSMAQRVLAVYREFETRYDKGTVIQFARLIDPSIPVAKDEYKNDPVYKAVQRYIRLGQRGDAVKEPTSTLPQSVVDRLLSLAFDLANPADVMGGLALAVKTASKGNGRDGWTEAQFAIVEARANTADSLTLMKAKVPTKTTTKAA